MSNERASSRCSGSQFQPPSASCSAEQPVDDDLDVLAEVRAEATAWPLMHGSTSPSKKGGSLVLPQHVGRGPVRGPAAPASFVGSTPKARSSCSVDVVEVHSGEWRAAAPRAVGALEGEQPRAPALRRDVRALGRDLVGRRVEQVAHDLPADGWVGVEQPVDDVHGDIVTPVRDTGRQESAAVHLLGACQGAERTSRSFVAKASGSPV